MRLFVGNLAFETTENDIQDAFERFGAVSEVALMMEPGTARSRGFAFVTMGNLAEAQAAVSSLNGADLSGRNINVSEARPREDRGGKSGGGNRSFSGGGQRSSGNRRY